VTRTVYLSAIAWAFMLCAQVHLGIAATTDTVPVATDDARLTHLAQKLASSAPESLKTIAPAEKSEPVTSDVSTPLIRRGSSLADNDTDPVSDRANPSAGLVKIMTSLGVVIGLILLARLGYARLGGKIATNSSPVVEVLSRTSVAPRSHVMLLRVGRRVLVVSDSSAGMRTLASVEDAQEVADLLGAVTAAKPTSISRSFSQLFHRADEAYEMQQAGLDGDVKAVDSTHRTRETVSGLLSKVRGLGREGGVR